MIIEVKKLISRKEYEGEFSFEYNPPQDKMLLPLCQFDGVVKVEGDYVIYEDNAVGVNLKLTYNLKGQCSYCLEDAKKTIEYSTEILFVPDKQDADNYYYDGNKVDLTAAVDDALLFSQPEVLLCKEGCEGIKLN
jgi:uncharacterized metal-binding protein YceD (DUF177 family)